MMLLREGVSTRKLEVYVYMLLKRHNWRKIKPRSQHPKKADEETIAASQKLTLNWKILG